MRSVVKPALVLSLGVLLSTAPAYAAGCLKGAAVGGLAGHAVNHGVVGAAAGCAVGHHEANKSAKQNTAQTQPSSGSGEQKNNGGGSEAPH